MLLRPHNQEKRHTRLQKAWGQTFILRICVMAEITMTRQLRLEHQGAVYNLVSCGNAREKLTFCSEDRARLLEALTMRSRVRRKISADCCAETSRVIAKQVYGARKS